MITTKYLFSFLAVFFLLSTTSCQNTGQEKEKEAVLPSAITEEPLLAITKMVFVDNADKGEYAVSLAIEQGVLKVGQKIDAVGNGKKYSFQVIEIKVDDAAVNEASKSENVFVVLQTTAQADQFDAGFTLINDGATSIPKTTAANANNSAQAGVSGTNCLFNDTKWTGAVFFNSCLFYAKGLSDMNCNKPYLMLGFKATDSPDNRQLLFTVCGFEAKIGKIDAENIEVALSGAESGDNKLAEIAGYKSGTPGTSFSLEITKYEKIAEDEALISGRYSGVVGGALSSKPIKITSGVFTDVSLRVFNTKY